MIICVNEIDRVIVKITGLNGGMTGDFNGNKKGCPFGQPFLLY